MPFFQDDKKLEDNSDAKSSTQAKHEKGTITYYLLKSSLLTPKCSLDCIWNKVNCLRLTT